MNSEQLKLVWQTQSSQARLTTDAERLIQELRRNQKHFNTSIFWRNIREAGIGLLMMPLWFYMGIRFSLPWTWYLVVPVLLWIAGTFLFELTRRKRTLSETDESLRQGAENSLAEVDYQIRLLRNVLWWYLLPMAVPITAFFFQVMWLKGSRDWLTVLIGTGLVLFEAIVFASIHKLNQDTVRTELEPRCRELQTLLASLSDEVPAANETSKDT